MNISKIKTNVRVSSIVAIDLSADEWGLDTKHTPRAVIDKVATFLNKRFNRGYNIGLTDNELVDSMYELMDSFKIYGAFHPEPNEVLKNLIYSVYRK
jgi:hypothetical protein